MARGGLPSVKVRIYSLVWACALPAIVGFALLTAHFIQRERAQIQQDSLITARALIRAVDRDLNTGITVALALANSPSLDKGDLAAFHSEASKALRPEFPGFNFVLSDRDAVQLLNTVRPYGGVMPDPASAARIRQVFDSGRPVISDVFIGGALKRPLVAIHAPVLRDGQVIYCLSVAFVPERLGQVLREQSLPPDRVVGIFDRQGVIVSRSLHAQEYAGKQGSPTLLAQTRGRQEAITETVTLEGEPVYTMYSRSPTSGWMVAIGVPSSVVWSETLASVRWIGLAVFLLLLAGSGVAWYLARQIGRSVHGLSSAALSLGEGGWQQAPVAPSFREADEAIKTLQSVGAELEHHRHRLESLIEERTAQLQSAMQEAQQANAAKDIFVANMSHELRTPMNAVLGMAHLLGTSGLTPEQNRYLDMLRAAGQSLLGILNDILDFSKMQAGKVELYPTRFRLDEVMHALAAIMSVSAGEKELELAIGVEPDVPRVLVGDALRLQQVLVNLAGNAIKFTERGEVAVSVQRVSRSPLALRFCVRDSGIGMSEDQMARLFSPFTQGDLSFTRRFGGTGLGLTISRGLIELMGGSIEVHSEPGRGSEFRFTLTFEAAEDGAPPHAGKLHLLLADDNHTSRTFIAKTVAAWGWTCDCAASGTEALARLRTGVRYDAVLLDSPMPDMDAMQAIGDMAQVPVVCMVNAYARGKMMKEMAGAHATAFLSKPVTASSLFDAVQTAMAPAGRDDVRRSAAPMLDGARILLVEDNPINQNVAKGLLEHAGAVVAVAEHGQAALDRLRAGDRYDLVLMDVQMPVMDGFTATRLIRAELGLQLPVIAMTAGVMESEREQCMAAGMDDFIAKPIDVEQMFAILSRHLR
ncbi:hybrid sensor histidine kinase/response regulator [Duganella callida]|uniref:Virulence sensor protein BvgS n=1 Tax=Duganella callida TaxID=2561932 RepID=A0A4Y9SES6_9BURK|nr:hybrid sensor histidine kinase/response regulator [Duganella callida]TFW19365.1 hybrid sensor histidine kinase/response regulator [Duganella callida]